MTHAARTGMTIPRLRRRLGLIGFGLMIVVLLAAMVVLLPIALAVGAVSDARTERRLALTKCVTCGEAIGLAEIRRAKEEGQARAAAWMQAVLASMHKPRVAAIWDVTCPTCGHQYVYRPDAALLSKELGPGEHTT